MNEFNLDDFFKISKIVYKSKYQQVMIRELKILKEIFEEISLAIYELPFLDSEDNYFQKMLNNLDFIKTYEGEWDIKLLMSIYKISEEDLDNYQFKFEKKCNPSFREISVSKRDKKFIEKNKLEKFKDDYEFKENNLSEIDLKKYEELEKEGKNININNVHYPLIVKLLKDKRVIFVNKCLSNLPKILKDKEKLEYDDFKIVHVKESIIDDILLEYIIKHDPIYITNTITRNIRKIYKYRNETQIKKYYEDKYTITSLKKIANLYQVSVFTLYTGMKIYNRFELEKAIERHLAN